MSAFYKTKYCGSVAEDNISITGVCERIKKRRYVLDVSGVPQTEKIRRAYVAKSAPELCCEVAIWSRSDCGKYMENHCSSLTVV